MWCSNYSKGIAIKTSTVKIALAKFTFAVVDDLLKNPVYNALMTGDAQLSMGTGVVKYFDQEVSPFAGFPHEYEKGFDELYDLMPAGRRILYATPGSITKHKGWQLLTELKGLQFVYSGGEINSQATVQITRLTNENVDEMQKLATLTKPGPFASRTIEFGHYHGIFENGKLAAMTGQRLHVGDYTEISAVCTHPDHLGKGYAATLINHQLKLIHAQGKKPFLHVKADNDRAIALYERLGFKVSRGMNFYFLKRHDGE